MKASPGPTERRNDAVFPTYDLEDGQPSLFLLRQSPRRSILTVFNWTDRRRSRSLSLKDLGLPVSSTMVATGVMDSNATFALEGGAIRLENQSPQSAVVIKLVDTAVARAAPTVTAQVPSQSKVGETIVLSARPILARCAIGYHWDFGDGTDSEGSNVLHCYTRAADFMVRLTVDGPDDDPHAQSFSIRVAGELKPTPDLRANRRFEQATDR